MYIFEFLINRKSKDEKDTIFICFSAVVTKDYCLIRKMPFICFSSVLTNEYLQGVMIIQEKDYDTKIFFV